MRYVGLLHPQRRIIPCRSGIDCPLFQFCEVVQGVKTHERWEISNGRLKQRRHLGWGWGQEGLGGGGEGDSGLSATRPTCTSKGISIGWGATSSTSSSDTSSKESSCSILQQQNIRLPSYNPPALTPTPLLDDSLYLSSIPLYTFLTPNLTLDI